MIFVFSHLYLRTRFAYIFIPLLVLCVFSLRAQEKKALDITRSTLIINDINAAVKPESLEVFSVSKTAVQIGDLPFRTLVVTRDEILKNNYYTLGDVLKNMPGMKVSQPGSAEEGELFLMRGMIGNYYTKILVDNIPISPVVTGTSHVSFNLPIRQATAIEVTYGPAASVYGADAAAGVINIITKHPEKRFFGGGDIAVGSGQFHYFNFMAGGRLGMDSKILNYTIYGSSAEYADLNTYTNKDQLYNPLLFDGIRNREVIKNSGVRYRDVTEDLIKNWGMTNTDFVNLVMPTNYVGNPTHSTSGNVPLSGQHLGINLDYGNFTFQYRYAKSSAYSSIGVSPYLYRHNNPLNQKVYSENQSSLRYEVKSDKWQLSSQLSYLHYRGDNVTNVGVNYGHGSPDLYTYTASNDFFAEQLIVYSPQQKIEIIGGLSYTHSRGLPTTNELEMPFKTSWYSQFGTANIPPHTLFGRFGFNPYTRSNLGAFAQAFFKSRWLNVVAGIRYDNNSMYGSTVNPRLAFLWKTSPKIQFRASLGSAYKAPAPNIVYKSVAYPALGEAGRIQYAYVPNTDLEPERFQSVELGIHYFVNRQLTFDFNAYISRHRNQVFGDIMQLDTFLHPNAAENTETYARTNFNKANSSSELIGLSAMLQAKDIYEPMHLNGSLNVNFQKGKEILPNSEERIDVFRQISPLSVQFAFDFELSKHFYFRFENTYMSSWYRRYMTHASDVDDPYNKVDGFYTLDGLSRIKLSKFVSVFVQVKNIFDAEYGGIDVTPSDINLKFNPQMRRNWRAGISINLD